MTGKAGRYSVGLLNIQTDDEPDIGAASTNFGVVRLKRDILRRSYIGVIGTSRSPALGDDGTNSVFGVDTGFAFYDSLTMVGYYAKTNTPGLHDKDHSYRGRFDYQADRLGVHGRAPRRRARTSSPKSGFLRRSDFVESLAQLRISRRPGVVAVGAAHQPRVRARLHHQRRARAGEPPVPDGAAHGNAKRRLVERALREHLRVRAGPVHAAWRHPGARSAPTATRSAWRSTRWAASARSPARSAPGHGGFYDGTRTDLVLPRARGADAAAVARTGHRR